MSTDLRFREATTLDAQLLARMNEQLIRDEEHRNPMSAEELESRMKAWLDGDYEAVVFENDAGTVGYALFRREAEHVYLRQFFVRAEQRRRGFGRAAIEWLRANSWRVAPRIRLEVLVGNGPGRAFWRSVGFDDYCITFEWNRSSR
jgi:GNAT superfamily N-acetyltransferase